MECCAAGEESYFSEDNDDDDGGAADQLPPQLFGGEGPRFLPRNSLGLEAYDDDRDSDEDVPASEGGPTYPAFVTRSTGNRDSFFCILQLQQSAFEDDYQDC